MASLCDFTQPDGTVTTFDAVDAQAAFDNGEITQSELDTINQALNNDTVIEQCRESDDVADESYIEIDSISATSPAPGVVTGEYTVGNTITQGSGVTATVTVDVKIGPFTVTSNGHTVAGGETVTGTFTRESVEAGQKKVCAVLQGDPTRRLD